MIQRIRPDRKSAERFQETGQAVMRIRPRDPISGQQQPAMDKSKPTILIVDDERFFINILVDLLKPMYRTVIALNGEQALERSLCDTPPNLILLDIVMPGMDGYEVCAELKKAPPSRDIPVIFLTNRTDVGDETRGFELGAIDYITKPISPPIVLARVNTHLTLERTRKELNSYARQLEETIAARTQDLTQEILDRRNVEEQLYRLSNFDPVTSLANERLFRQQLSQSLKHCQRSHNSRIALLLLDASHLVQLQKTVGQYHANALFRQLTKRLQQCIRASDSVGRLGPDKFAVALLDTADTGSVVRAAEKIAGSLKQPFQVENNEFHTDTHIGIALYPDDSGSVDSLIRNAEMTLHCARANDDGHIAFFSHQSENPDTDLPPLESELENAVLTDQLLLHYQPVFETRGKQLVSVEAIVKWRHPRLGMLQPDYFLPIAEESELIVSVIEWVLLKACSKFREWKERGLGDFSICVNISSSQYYYHNRCIPTITEVLERTGMPPERLSLCVSESVFIEGPEATTDKLIKLRNAGIRLAIDNFGIGYSSLSFIGKFPIDSLRIHRSLIAGFDTDPQNTALVEAIVTMAHILGLKVTARGVETREQLRVLAGFGCETIQGQLLSHPLPEQEFEAFCERLYKSGAA